MTKSILISVRPEHAVNILNGKKTLELRKDVPKDFVGWVYMYVTKGKPRLAKFPNSFILGAIIIGKKKVKLGETLNGEVVARWWHDEYEQICIKEVNETDDIFESYKLATETLNENQILSMSYLTIPNIQYYWGDGKLYAWHIKKLEVFDKPMGLNDFYIYRKAVVHCGMDCPPYVDEVRFPLTKTPPSWRYVWTQGQ